MPIPNPCAARDRIISSEVTRCLMFGLSRSLAKQIPDKARRQILVKQDKRMGNQLGQFNGRAAGKRMIRRQGKQPAIWSA